MLVFMFTNDGRSSRTEELSINKGEMNTELIKRYKTRNLSAKYLLALFCLQNVCIRRHASARSASWQIRGRKI